MFKQHVKVNFASNDPLPRVEATPIMWYLALEGAFYQGNPVKNMYYTPERDWAKLVLSSNWEETDLPTLRNKTRPKLAQSLFDSVGGLK